MAIPLLPLAGLLTAGATTYGVKKGLENKKMKRKANAEIPSTRKYWKLIFVLHDLHFPFKRTYERNGILSYQFTFVLHLGH